MLVNATDAQFSLVLDCEGALWFLGNKKEPVVVPWTGGRPVMAALCEKQCLVLDVAGCVWKGRFQGDVFSFEALPAPLAMCVAVGVGYWMVIDEEGGLHHTDNPFCLSRRGLQVIKAIPRARTVACGDSFAMVETMSHGIWGLGSNRHGQLGLGSLCSVPCPTKCVEVNLPGPLRCLTTGSNYTLAIDCDGNAWTCGDNAEGQLGRVPNEDSSFLRQVHSIGEIVSASAGKHHCLVIDQQRCLWGWGSNKSGQLGILPLNSFSSPTLVLREVAAATAFALHSSATICDGELIVFGDNSQRQLGFPDTERGPFPPSPLSIQIAPPHSSRTKSARSCTNSPS